MVAARTTSFFRRLRPAVAAALPVAVLGVGLGVGLAAAPAARADTAPMPAGTVPPSTPPVTPAPPTAPTDLTATRVTATSVTLTWTASTPGCCAIEAYVIEYAPPFTDAIPLTMVGNVTTATIRLSPTNEYRIRVSARDTTGHTSPWSNRIVVMTPATDTGPDTLPPTAPANLIVQDGTLSWTASTDDVGVTGYHVYRFDGWYTSTLVGIATSTTYPLPPPSTSGLRNLFYVRARDAAGNLSIATNTVDPYGPTPSPTPGPGCASFTLNGASCATD
ncbi:hypothetical protein BSA16_07850 [Micromonospora sp. Rc5]|uniref:fibronectin type III domain-containing protein n=2 Tax=unclassified Micromonospora TaxID=2617518 RepID=UPI00098D554F|nr:fibronectin type III domain-containing protein [Micromonospora sp. Rc5]MDI5937174.1 fibronectin type III domain-containing protein [Micromonospora sp. DH15]OON32018.1 hypothetical protein BSA16_07850 [Micromonospora sp. Rc5]